MTMTPMRLRMPTRTPPLPAAEEPAGDEKIGYTPVGADTAATTMAGGESETDLRRGGLGWLVDHKALAALGIAGAFVLLVLLILVFGGDDGGDGSGDPTGRDEVATQGNQGTSGALPVDEYADRACAVFGDELVDPDARFQASLQTASAAPVATPELYDEIEASAAAFSAALATTADRLEDLASPRVEGGEAAHEDTVADYRDAASTVTELAGVAGAYDPTTATQAETVTLGEEVNGLLTDVNEALGPEANDVPEINAAFEASNVCAELTG